MLKKPKKKNYSRELPVSLVINYINYLRTYMKGLTDSDISVQFVTPREYSLSGRGEWVVSVVFLSLNEIVSIPNGKSISGVMTQKTIHIGTKFRLCFWVKE